MVSYGDRRVLARPDADVRTVVETDLRRLAREELEPRLRALAAVYDLEPGRVSIRNQRSRWGSCARDGNIALNFRLVQMPPAIRDYVLAARADAPAPAESFAALLAARRAGLSRLQGRGAMAANPGQGAVLRLTAANCVLRAWWKSDAASLVEHANNRNVARHLRDRFPHPYTRAHAAAFLGHVAGADITTNFAIVVDDVAVGGIGYIRGSDVERFSAEVGYWLGEAYWGRGIMTDAVTRLTQHLFEDVKLLRAFALPLGRQPGLEPGAREGRLRAGGAPPCQLREVRTAAGSISLCADQCGVETRGQGG